MRRELRRLGEKVIPSPSDSLWKIATKLLGCWFIVAVTALLLGFNHFFAVWLILPIALLVVVVTKIAPPAIGIAGLADDIGLIDLPPIFNPVRIGASIISGFGDLGFFAQVSEGSAEWAEIGVRRGVSIAITSAKFLVTLVRSFW